MLNSFAGFQGTLAVSTLAFPLVVSDRVNLHKRAPKANLITMIENLNSPWSRPHKRAFNLVIALRIFVFFMFFTSNVLCENCMPYQYFFPSDPGGKQGGCPPPRGYSGIRVPVSHRGLTCFLNNQAGTRAWFILIGFSLFLNSFSGLVLAPTFSSARSRR